MVAAGTYSDDTSGGGCGSMEFWPEFLASSGGREFVAGGVGGMAGVLAGHPLDTLRIRLQQPPAAGAPRRRDAHPSAPRLLRGILRAEGPCALYRGMAAPLASVAFQVSRPFFHVAALPFLLTRSRRVRSGRASGSRIPGPRTDAVDPFDTSSFSPCLSPRIAYFLVKGDRFQR